MKAATNIQPIQSVDGTVWKLPARDLSEFSYFGWILILIGGFISLFMLSWIAGPFLIGVKTLVREKSFFGWLFIGFSMMGFFGLIYGLRFMLMGKNILQNRSRCEVELSNDRLVLTEKLGWLDWRRKIKVASIESLTIQEERKFNQRVPSTKRTANRSIKAGLTQTMAALVAKTGSDSSKFIAVGYPVNLLQELAERIVVEVKNNNIQRHDDIKIIAARQQFSATGKPLPYRDASSLRGTIPVVKVGDRHEPEPLLPKTSLIKQHNQSADEIAFEVPPTGLVQGSKGLFVFAVFWLAMSTIFFGVVVTDLFVGGFEWGEVLACGFVFLFVAIGIGMLIMAIHMAHRKVLIGVLGQQLFVERTTIFRTSWHEYDRDQLMYIEVGDSSLSVNERPVKELKIVTREGQSTGLLSQLTEEELAWIAFQLNKLLDLKTFEELGKFGPHWQRELGIEDASQVGDSHLPEKTRLRIDADGRQIRINIPAQGILKALPGILFAVMFGGISIILIAMQDQLDLLFMLLPVVFVSIAICVLIASLVYCYRGYEISASANSLDIRRSGIFGSKNFHWIPGQLEKIDLGDSGWKINQQPAIQLNIVGQPKLKFMFGWKLREIAIVAAHLNHILQLHPISPAADFTQADR